jgi:hypothetical protein
MNFFNYNYYKEMKSPSVETIAHVMAGRIDMLSLVFIDSAMNMPTDGYLIPTGDTYLSSHHFIMKEDWVRLWLEKAGPAPRGYYYGLVQEGQKYSLNVYERFDRLEDAMYATIYTGATYAYDVKNRTQIQFK